MTHDCPHLRRVAMLYCDACPVKKLVPEDQADASGRCRTGDFRECPLYREALASTAAGSDANAENGRS